VAHAKLPPLSDEAKAKAAENAAKAAHGNQVANYQLCKSMDRVAAVYQAEAKKAGKDVKPPTATPPCADPGPFVCAAAAARSRRGPFTRQVRRSATQHQDPVGRAGKQEALTSHFMRPADLLHGPLGEPDRYQPVKRCATPDRRVLRTAARDPDRRRVRRSVSSTSLLSDR
jgi:hypothetical protein